MMRENLSSGCANNKDSDQSAHPRRLISAFVIRFPEGIISKLVANKISFLASLSSRGDWFMSSSFRNSEDRFCSVEAHMV